MLTLYVLLLTNFFHSFCRCCGSKSSSVPCTIDSFVRGLVVCSTTGGSQCFTIHIYNYGNYWLVTQYFYLLLHTPTVLSFLFFVNISLSLTFLPSFLNIIPFFFPIPLSFSPSFLFFHSPPLYFCPSFPSSSFFLLLSSTSFYSAPSSILPPVYSPSPPQPSPNPPPVLPTTSLLLLFFSPLLLLFCHLYFPPFFLSLSLFLCCAPYRHLSFLFIVTFHFLSLFQPSSCSFSFFYLILFSSSYLGFPLYTLFLFLLFSSSFLLSPPPFHRFSLYSILTNFPPPPFYLPPFTFTLFLFFLLLNLVSSSFSFSFVPPSFLLLLPLISLCILDQSSLFVTFSSTSYYSLFPPHSILLLLHFPSLSFLSSYSLLHSPSPLLFLFLFVVFLNKTTLKHKIRYLYIWSLFFFPAGVVFVVSAVAISTVEFTCNNRESAIRSPLLSELSMQKVNILKVRFSFSIPWGNIVA